MNVTTMQFVQIPLDHMTVNVLLDTMGTVLHAKVGYMLYHDKS